MVRLVLVVLVARVARVALVALVVLLVRVGSYQVAKTYKITHTEAPTRKHPHRSTHTKAPRSTTVLGRMTSSETAEELRWVLWFGISQDE